MSSALDLVGTLSPATSGEGPAETSPLPLKHTVLPHECAQGYAERLLGGYVVRTNELTRVVLGELLLERSPLKLDQVATRVAKRLEEEVNKNLMQRIRNARQRITSALPGILQSEGQDLWLAPEALREQHLDNEGLEAAVRNAKTLARSRINNLWYKKQEALMQRLFNEHNLSSEELNILRYLILRSPKGIKVTESRGHLLLALIEKIPGGYIEKSDDTFYAGQRTLSEIEGHRIYTYEDTEAIELPEDPFGFLNRRVKVEAPANEPPRKEVLSNEQWALGYAAVIVEKFDIKAADSAREILAMLLALDPDERVKDKPISARGVEEINSAFGPTPIIEFDNDGGYRLTSDTISKLDLTMEEQKRAAIIALSAACERHDLEWQQAVRQAVCGNNRGEDDGGDDDERDYVEEYIIDKIIEGAGIGWSPDDCYASEMPSLILKFPELILEQDGRYFVASKLFKRVGSYATSDMFEIPLNPFDFGRLKGQPSAPMLAEEMRRELERWNHEQQRQRAAQTRKWIQSPIKSAPAKRRSPKQENILRALDPDRDYYINPRCSGAKDLQGVPINFVPPSRGANYDVTTLERFGMRGGRSSDRVLIKWKDDRGRDREGSVNWSHLVTAEAAEQIRSEMAEERKEARAREEARNAARAEARAEARSRARPPAKK